MTVRDGGVPIPIDAFAVSIPLLVPLLLSVPVSVTLLVSLTALSVTFALTFAVSVPISISVSVSVSVSISIFPLRLGTVSFFARAVVDIDVLIFGGRHGDSCRFLQARPRIGKAR